MEPLDHDASFNLNNCLKSDFQSLFDLIYFELTRLFLYFLKIHIGTSNIHSKTFLRIEPVKHLYRSKSKENDGSRYEKLQVDPNYLKKIKR